MPLPSFEELLEQAEEAHGHLCAGQILGVRMAIYGLKLLGIDDPRGVDRKRTVTFVEIDRCASDAIGVVTGCRLGKRALKFRDWGKMAATFVDAFNGKGVRLVAREESKQLAAELHPELATKNLREMAAYRELSDEQLFSHQRVHVDLPAHEMPGYKASCVTCEECGEGISFNREVHKDGRVLCRGCAGERYYKPVKA